VANRQLFEQQAKERELAGKHPVHNCAQGEIGRTRDKIAKIAGLSLA